MSQTQTYSHFCLFFVSDDGRIVWKGGEVSKVRGFEPSEGFGGWKKVVRVYPWSLFCVLPIILAGERSPNFCVEIDESLIAIATKEGQDEKVRKKEKEGEPQQIHEDGKVADDSLSSLLTDKESQYR